MNLSKQRAETLKKYLVSKGFNDKDPLFPKIVPSFSKENLPILELKKEMIKLKSENIQN